MSLSKTTNKYKLICCLTIYPNHVLADCSPIFRAHQDWHWEVDTDNRKEGKSWMFNFCLKSKLKIYKIQRSGRSLAHLKKGQSTNWRGFTVTFKKNIALDDQVYFFDKNTGEKFTKLSSVLLNEIHHHYLKSEMTGKTVLLSEFGIQRRFSGTPHQWVKSIRNLFPRFLNLG